MQITYFWTIYRKVKKAVLPNIGDNLMSEPIEILSCFEKNNEKVNIKI